MEDPKDPELESPEDGETTEVVVEITPNDKPRGQTLWVRDDTWEKLTILRKDFNGTWDRLMEIVCEQLLGSGLVSERARHEIREITQRGGEQLINDSGWRTTFRIGEPWPETAATQTKIAEELVKLTSAVNGLIEAVEDHATAVIETELISNGREGA